MSTIRARLTMPMTRRDVVIRVGALSWLTFVWVLLWGAATIANIVGGILVGVLILVLTPLPPVPVEGKLHLLSALRLLGRVLADLAKSSVEVAWLACRPGPPPLTAILRVHAKVKSDLVLALLVDAINLVPGTIVLEVDRTARDLYIHVLDVGTPERIERFYSSVAHLEQLFIRAFERDEDWQPREAPDLGDDETDRP